MKEQLVTYKVALLAKEKGFDWKCLDTFDNKKRATNRYNIDVDGLNDFVEKEDALMLKDLMELSNSEISDDFVARPTQALLQKWLREEFDIITGTYANASGYCWEIHKTPKFGGSHIKDSDFSGPNDSGNWNSYEEALEEGLNDALKLIVK